MMVRHHCFTAQRWLERVSRQSSRTGQRAITVTSGCSPSYLPFSSAGVLLNSGGGNPAAYL
jgi:hypothetical protein